MIFSEWRKTTISNVATKVFSGGTPNTKIDEFWGGNIPWLSSGETRNRFIEKTENTITNTGVNKSSTKLAKIGDTVIASAGQGFTRGQVSYCLIDTYINQSIIAIRPNFKIINSKFLFYNLSNRYQELRQISDANAIRGSLTTKLIGNLDIFLPLIHEQQKISEILSSIDEKIELNNKISKTLEEMAQAIFKSWFVNFEPSKNGEFIESELGSIPKGWRVGHLRDVLENIKESTTPGSHLYGLPYLPIDQIPMKSLGINSFLSGKEAMSSLSLFQKDDIIIGAMRVYFHRVVISPFHGVTRTTCFVLRAKSRECRAFAALHCTQDKTIDFAQSHSKGTTMPYAIWENGLAEMKLVLPPKEVLYEFSNTVEPLLQLIRDSVFEQKNLEELRDSLLPKLMTGEIRVPFEEGSNA